MQSASTNWQPQSQPSLVPFQVTGHAFSSGVPQWQMPQLAAHVQDPVDAGQSVSVNWHPQSQPSPAPFQAASHAFAWGVSHQQ